MVLLLRRKAVGAPRHLRMEKKQRKEGEPLLKSLPSKNLLKKMTEKYQQNVEEVDLREARKLLLQSLRLKVVLVREEEGQKRERSLKRKKKKRKAMKKKMEMNKSWLNITM